MADTRSVQAEMECIFAIMQTAIVLISSDLRASATERTAIHPGF